MKLIVSLCIFALLIGSTLAKSNPEDFEFFENKIRPALVEHCYQCHTTEGGQKGGLLLDSRTGWEVGGDTGPVITPGKPDESLLIEAIRYDSHPQMPPDGKLPDEVIRDFERWIAMGTPDPRVPQSPAKTDAFDLYERAKFWCFQPIKNAPPPDVQDELWVSNPIDRFILGRLEEIGLQPAVPADKRTLIRRLSYALTGLPPTPDEIDAFLNDRSPSAYENLVDRLLASPHFGERWARYWMDLVRYAESKGHEGDYSIANTWQYRDYLIRAFNTDVPYNQFVMEHVAGDLLENPRFHPEHDFNESAVGTAFYHLGDGTHSPVDIRQNEADRIANMIDVTTKTFLGLTVACARCHDHKFDAITTKDYYALYSIIESSRCTNHELYPVKKIQEILQALDKLKPGIRRAYLALWREDVESIGDYLLAAAEIINDMQSARESVRKAFAEVERANPLLVADFEDENFDGWEITGDAFGTAPVKGNIGTQNRVKAFKDERLVNSFHNGDEAKGTLTSPSFRVVRNYINLLIGGGRYAKITCVNLLLDGKVVRTAVGFNSDELRPATWDVSKLRGKAVKFQIVDEHTGGWGHVLVDHIVQSNLPLTQFIVADFEDRADWNSDLKVGQAAWKVTGDAFGKGPAKGNLDDQSGVAEFKGKALVNSFHAGNKSRGTLTSPPFQIHHGFINLRVGGGDHPGKTCVNLLVDSEVVRTASGDNTDTLASVTWHVSKFLGETAQLQIVDTHVGDWGRVLVDHVVTSPQPETSYLPDADVISVVSERHDIHPARLENWLKVMTHPKAGEKNHPLYPWFTIGLAVTENSQTAPNSVGAEWRQKAKAEERPTPHTKPSADASHRQWLGDFRDGSYGDWFIEGNVFGETPSVVGGLVLKDDGSAKRFTATGVFNNRSSRLPGTLRSHTFVIDRDFISIHAMGYGAQLRVIVNNFQLIRNPLYGHLDQRNLSTDTMRWHRFDLSRWKGQPAYVEIIHNTGDGNFVAVNEVVMHNGELDPIRERTTIEWLAEQGEITSAETLKHLLREAVGVSLSAWQDGSTVSPTHLLLLNTLLQNELLTRAANLKSLRDEYSHLVAQIPKAELAKTAYGRRGSQQVIGMTDGNGLDGVVFVRGSYDKPGEVVPRRFLEVLSGSDAPFDTNGSGRLDLAQAITNPNNPLTARVIVNRVWHHIFGRGIVATVDNFGKLGERPTHPQLLDYLASQFIADGWSTKNLIRLMVTSRTYQMSSKRSKPAHRLDPDNLLLQSMRVRRLDAEALRDGILAVSGNLDRRLYGESVPVHLTKFMNGRGKPAKSGPLDGDGRRSIYIAIRRNFLPSIALAFDMPIPFSTFGRRNITNVPAQSLTLMNAPFVIGQAAFWAAQVLELKTRSPAEKIDWMYQRAFGRKPHDWEVESAMILLHSQAKGHGLSESVALKDTKPWSDLGHALFNLKEFIYIF